MGKNSNAAPTLADVRIPSPTEVVPELADVEAEIARLEAALSDVEQRIHDASDASVIRARRAEFNKAVAQAVAAGRSIDEIPSPDVDPAPYRVRRSALAGALEDARRRCERLRRDAARAIAEQLADVHRDHVRRGAELIVGLCRLRQEREVYRDRLDALGVAEDSAHSAPAVPGQFLLADMLTSGGWAGEWIKRAVGDGSIADPRT